MVSYIDRRWSCDSIIRYMFRATLGWNEMRNWPVFLGYCSSQVQMMSMRAIINKRNSRIRRQRMLLVWFDMYLRLLLLLWNLILILMLTLILIPLRHLAILPTTLPIILHMQLQLIPIRSLPCIRHQPLHELFQLHPITLLNLIQIIPNCIPINLRPLLPITIIQIFQQSSLNNNHPKTKNIATVRINLTCWSYLGIIQTLT